MGKKWLVGLAILFLLVLGFAGLFWPRANEPVFKGRKLSAWVQRLPAANNATRGVMWAPLVKKKTPDELEAEEAVRQIGTNALPFLMDEMRAKESGWRMATVRAREWFIATWQRIVLRKASTTYTSSFYDNGKSDAELRHWNASRGLNALGPLAKPVIPDLVAILNAGPGTFDKCPDAAYALAGMGSEGMEQLIHCATNASKPQTGDWPQICAIWALGQNPTNSQAALGSLLTDLTNKDATIRMSAAWALGQIRSQPELEAPALATALGDTDPSVHNMVQQSLVLYGMTNFHSAELMLYLTDPKPHVRMAATNALKVLFPKEILNPAAGK